jgi:hypothetical protein
MRLVRSGLTDIGYLRAGKWRYIYAAYAYAGTKTDLLSGISSS